jgi:hypothetical protein
LSQRFVVGTYTFAGKILENEQNCLTIHMLVCQLMNVVYNQFDYFFLGVSFKRLPTIDVGFQSTL